jgi:phosphate transport system permease protein
MSSPQTFEQDFILKSGSKRIGERIILSVLFSASFLTILITAGIAWSLITPAIEFFRQVSVVDFLTGTRWAPRFKPASFGVVPLLVGTLWTTVIALMVAVPFGLGAAMYLSEYASEKSRRKLKPVLELLAGIPTVVYGFFAIEFVTRIVLKGWLQLDIGTFSVLSAGLVMGVMIIPTIADGYASRFDGPWCK